MLQITDLTSNRNFRIRNFEEDKIATLNAHRGLRYFGKINDFFKFSGNFYLTNQLGELIESFEIEILVNKSYPYTFPIVISSDDKIEKSEDFHINAEGDICLEHTYVANSLAKRGLRLFDFANYFLTKYFSWVLVKKYGDASYLQEWQHKELGTRQFYETLLKTTDKHAIRFFLESFSNATKIRRNDKCYCGKGKKLKHCHLNEIQFLKATNKSTIQKDIELFW